MKHILCVILLFVIASPILCAQRGGGGAGFNVVNYGAIGNGVSDDSNAFLKAWQAVCGATQKNPTLLIPKGKTFLLQPLVFRGPCKSTINVKLQGTITAPKSVKAWKFSANSNRKAWVSFKDINGLNVNGGGKINGEGAPWWTKATPIGERATALQFLGCNKVTLQQVTHVNSPRNHISIDSSNGVFISNINIIAPETSPNTDGIDISKSSNVKIQNSNIGTGDDCVAINSGSTYINITGVFCGPGHGLSVGSLGKNHQVATVEHVYVHNCTFTKTQNGARIKTVEGGSGYARNIKYDNIRLNEVKNPVVINQNYVDRLSFQSKSQRTAVKVSDVTFSNIKGTSSREDAIQIECDEVVGGCTNIVLENINIKCTCGKTSATCSNAKGKAISCSPSVPCFK